MTTRILELTVANPETSEVVALDVEVDITGQPPIDQLEAFAVALWEESPDPDYEGWLPFMVRLR